MLCVLPVVLLPAHPAYLDLIPNGRAVYHLAGIWHAVGHTHAWMMNVSYEPTMLSARFALSGFNRNAFGLDFAKAGRRWTEGLCRADSDGDGLSNGEELGDPDCLWSVGMKPSRLTDISHPGYHARHTEVGWELERPAQGGERFTTQVVRWATAWDNSSVWSRCPDLTPSLPIYAWLHPMWAAIAAALRWRDRRLPTPRLGTMWAIWALLALGVSISLHRYFSHRAFETGPLFKNVLALLGNLAEGDPSRWAQMHRIHHRVCDEEMDYHSPVPRGFAFAQFQWVCVGHPMIRGTWAREALTRDISDDPEILPLLLHGEWPKWALLGSLPAWTLYYWLYHRSLARRATRASCGKPPKAAAPSLRLAMASGFVATAWYWLLPSWGAIMATSLVNSATHMWGAMPFADGNGRHQCTARNTWWLQLVLFGENWHNNHHAAPSSASTWVAWHQVDVIYLVIRALEACGLVWNVNVHYPTPPRSAAASYAEERFLWLSSHAMLLAVLLATWLRQARQRRGAAALAPAGLPLDLAPCGASVQLEPCLLRKSH